LTDLGVADAATLMPVEAGHDCQEVVGSAYADAVFALPPALAEPEPDRPRLGIFIADGEQGVRIGEVIADSVAEAIGLREADEIVRAAGVKTRKADELIEIVHRQAPGTWLPLSVMRDGKEIEFIAKFPPRPRPEP
jgi:S1-C subfamily serine protease